MVKPPQYLVMCSYSTKGHASLIIKTEAEGEAVGTKVAEVTGKCNDKMNIRKIHIEYVLTTM